MFLDPSLSPLFTAAESFTTPQGRVYRAHGQLWPSITTVLKAKESMGLVAWEKRVGTVEAERVRRVSSARGELLHTCTEHYLRTGEEPQDLMPNIQAYWRQLKPYLENVTLVAAEQTIVHPRFGVAGRFDFLVSYEYQVATFPHRFTLWDLKTNRTATDDLSPASARDREDKYLLQLSVYQDALLAMKVSVSVAAILPLNDMPWHPLYLTPDARPKYLKEFETLVTEYKASEAWQALQAAYSSDLTPDGKI